MSISPPQVQNRETISVCIPVFNEEKRLESTAVRLDVFFSKLGFKNLRIVIADNGSFDRTSEIGRSLQKTLRNIDYLRFDKKGRGHALKEVWLNESASVLSYMDADLSTQLSCFLDLVRPIISQTASISIGSRLCEGARVSRGLRRELISRGYNKLIRHGFQTRFFDAQCGFKALAREAAVDLLPLVKSEGWFFDTELLLLAEKRRWRIHEFPVIWQDDPSSTVKLLPTIWEDLRGLCRMKRTLKTFSTTAVR